MPKTRHVVRPHVKEQILKRLKEEGVPVAKLAEEHGISIKTVYGWLSRGMTNKEPSLLAYARFKKENQALKELVGNLTLMLEAEKKRSLAEARPPTMSKLQLARKLGAARSTLYYQSRLDVKDEQLRQAMLAVLHLHPSYGYRRLALHLHVNKKRTLRVMQRYGIKPYRRRGKKPKYVKPSMADMNLPNLVVGYFPNTPGDVWVSDFTYLPYDGRFIYVATVMDLYSREIVGWAVSGKHDTALVAAALYDALEHCPHPRVLHSDRGSEYLSQAYMELATNCGIAMSYRTKASPWENGYRRASLAGSRLTWVILADSRQSASLLRRFTCNSISTTGTGYI